MEPFVSADVVARHAGVSLGLVRKWTTRSYLPVPHHRLPGGRGVRFRISEIDAWLRGESNVTS